MSDPIAAAAAGLSRANSAFDHVASRVARADLPRFGAATHETTAVPPVESVSSVDNGGMTDHLAYALVARQNHAASATLARHARSAYHDALALL